MRNMHKLVEEGKFLASQLYIQEIDEILDMDQKGDEICVYTLIEKAYAAGAAAGIRYEKKRQRELKKAARG